MVMVLRQALGRPASRVLNPRFAAVPGARRGLAAPASGTFQYDSGEAAGVKWACRDLAGPTTTLALVSRAGTRYQPLPGLAEGLEKFAFRNTHRRSALRLQREAELFGASLFSHHSRENVVIGAKFFRDDLPYFVEELAEVASMTKFLDYEFNEQVMDLIHTSQKEVAKNPKELAISAAHSVAFHRGLGEPVHPTPSSPLSKYLSHDALGSYSTLAYRKSNVAIVANGAESAELSKWVGEFFKDMRTEALPGVPGLEMSQTKYFGGEERIAHSGGNSMCIAFPGSSSLTGGFYKPEIAVLAALLGGESSIKWSPGFSPLAQATVNRPGLKVSTKSAIYSDAGLLYVNLTGPAYSVADAAIDVVETIRKIASGDISKENFEKARAYAKFAELEQGENILTGLELSGSGLVHDGKPYQLDESAKKIGEVTQDQVKKAAATFLEFKSSVASVGDLFMLPFADELGLKV